MTGGRHGLSLFPPLLVGLVAAVAMGTSAGLLLYSDDGLLPALTLILTTEVGALGLGLWAGSVSTGSGMVDHIRRRWLFSLLAFAFAATLSAVLSFTGDLPRSGLGQGVGLGFLGGLPLFSIGSLLGAMGCLDKKGRPLLPSVGAPSAVGAAVGFLLVGSVLLPNASPYTLYLACLVILSGGALLQGWILDGRPSVEVLEVASAPWGDLRMEERVVGSPRRELKVLLEGALVRGAEDPDGNPGRDWEAAILEGLGREGRRPGSILYLGGGSGTFVRLLSQRFPDTRVHVVERNSGLAALARSHFRGWDGWETVRLEIGDPLSFSGKDQSPFAMIIVDCAVLPSLGGVPILGESGWRFLGENLEPRGVMFMGGFQAPEGYPALFPLEVLREGQQWFEGASVYQTEPAPASRRLLEELGNGPDTLLLFSTAGAVDWPFSLSAFQFRPTAEI